MNNRKLRVILFATTALFLVGVTWAIIVIVRRNNDKTIENQTQQQSSPTPTTDQTTTTDGQSAPAATASVPAPQNKQRTATVKETVIVEESAEATAWASAGVNPDGSTYAEAHAQ